MIQKTINFRIAHPDPHAHKVSAFRLKMSNDVADPYIQVGLDIPFDRNTVPVGDGVADVPASVTVDVPYGPIDFYFICYAINDLGVESSPSDPPALVSFSEVFLPPVLSVV